jgi:hypothetical protein
MVAMVACAIYAASPNSASIEQIAIQALSWSAPLILFFVLYPQLRFKPKERTLVVDEAGVFTTIGRRSGMRKWAEISSITEDGDFIILHVANRNAFIVPPRAFRTLAERAEFLAFARQAKANVS